MNRIMSLGTPLTKMKKTISLISVFLSFALLLSGCGSSQKTAKLAILNRFTSTMMYVPDEERDQEPEPEPEVYTVKRGDEVEGLEITSVTDSKVEFKTYFEYYDGRNYSKKFSVSRGETIWLTEVGLMDADHSYTVTYIDE